MLACDALSTCHPTSFHRKQSELWYFLKSCSKLVYQMSVSLSLYWHPVIVYPMHWIDAQISFFFRPSVCLLTDRLSNDYVHNSLPLSSRKFACGSEMWLLRCLLFVRQTGSSLPILEVCGFQFSQFSGSGDHIFQQISTKSHTQIKLSNADFVFNGE